ncbi:MAG: DUF2313 domain-containing protein [Methylophaga sp.]|nr:DUF2313 domain-containing protein [Methylophaga sp.]
MAQDVTAYTDQLISLMPRGVIWDEITEHDTHFTALLTALAQEFARIDGRTQQLIDETDPRSTFEMLFDWEQWLGLPGECSAQANTLEQRRQAVWDLLTSTGGQSRQYFINLAARLGYTITITEFNPFTVGGTVDESLYGQNWQFAWQVNAPEETIDYFTVASDINMALANWGNERLECAITRLKPAHTYVLFSYGGA